MYRELFRMKLLTLKQADRLVTSPKQFGGIGQCETFSTRMRTREFSAIVLMLKKESLSVNNFFLICSIEHKLTTCSFPISFFYRHTVCRKTPRLFEIRFV